MPVEALQIHIGGIGHGNVIPHLAPGQQLGVAPLGNGHPQDGGLIVIGQLDDLARIFQGHIKGLIGEPPIGRGGDLPELVAV